MIRPNPAARYERPSPEGHYVVKSGDTLYSIAFRHHLDFRDLAVWNDIGPGYLIRGGDVLRLSPPIGFASEDVASIQTFPAERTPTLSPEVRPEASVAPSMPAAINEPSAEYAWQWPVGGSVIRPFAEGIKGIDIAGTLGQPVLAAAPGKVVYSGSALKGYGELIIIKHDDLYLSAYGHNRRRLVDEGAMVAKGQAIGELGLGPEQKPILHFEIREKGKPVNPVKLLPQR